MERSFVGAAKSSFYQISAYIRLGRKYQLKGLYEQSLQFLKSHYTDNFDRWMKTKSWEPREWDSMGTECIGVVNLARLVNEPSLLPAALLSCVYMDEDIVQGLELEDGTRETLAPEDLARCFKAGTSIRQATIAGVVRTLQDKVSSACETQGNCVLALHRALQGLHKVTWLLGCCPVRLTVDDLLDHHATLGTCADCAKMVEERHRKERALLWAQLPDLLDVEVPEWGNPASQNEA